MSQSAIIEALLRIEHKVDMVIEAMIATGTMIPHPPSMDSMEFSPCPICKDPIMFRVDVPSESVIRSCGCHSTKSAVAGISSLLSPPENDNVRSKQEDQEHPGGSGGGAVPGQPPGQAE